MYGTIDPELAAVPPQAGGERERDTLLPTDGAAASPRRPVWQKVFAGATIVAMILAIVLFWSGDWDRVVRIMGTEPDGEPRGKSNFTGSQVTVALGLVLGPPPPQPQWVRWSVTSQEVLEEGGGGSSEEGDPAACRSHRHTVCVSADTAGFFLQSKDERSGQGRCMMVRATLCCVCCCFMPQHVTAMKRGLSGLSGKWPGRVARSSASGPGIRRRRDANHACCAHDGARR